MYVVSFCVLWSLLLFCSNFVTSIVQQKFPGFAKRFLASADWHFERYGIRPLFGLFWNVCINAPFPGQKRVHCLPHADYKNIVGVCVVGVYIIPGIFLYQTMQRFLNLLFLET